jgi:hypothetical protein
MLLAQCDATILKVEFFLYCILLTNILGRYNFLIFVANYIN